MMDDAEYKPKKGGGQSSRPSLPFTRFDIHNADTYSRAVTEAYGLRADGKGGYRAEYGSCPVIEPKIDAGRCWALEAWVEYWLHLGMRKRAAMAVKAVLYERKEWAVPAELPWGFDPRWPTRVTVPLIPTDIKQSEKRSDF